MTKKYEKILNLCVAYLIVWVYDWKWVCRIKNFEIKDVKPGLSCLFFKLKKKLFVIHTYIIWSLE